MRIAADENNASQITKEDQAARNLISEKKFSEAEKIYRSLIDQEIINYSIYGGLAIACGMQGDTENLAKYAAKSIEHNYRYPQGHNNLGCALQQMGDLKQAIQSYKNAINLKPDYLDAYKNLGKAYTQNGMPQDAINCLLKALKYCDAKREIYIHLGSIFEELGLIEKAILHFELAIRQENLALEALNNTRPPR